jgi:diadenosine tetraphosphate (Ap4A) HIT family hydrolase
VSRAPREESCEFCRIARGEEDSAEIISEGDRWIAFFPLKPATPGHTLVIPREHVADLWQADQSLAADLMGAVIRVGRAIDAALIPEGMNLITSSGEAAEQTIYHLHLHVVPRWRNDGFGHIWPPRGDLAGIDLDGVADRIRAAASGLAEDDDD